MKMVLKKGPWSIEEDMKLIAYINRYGIWNWRKMPQPAGLSRCGKSCRLRWMNYLNPQIKRGNFTCEEDETITRMHKVLGNKWCAMAAALPGRTDNEIKNHWHTHLRKRLRRPVTEQSQVVSSSTTSDVDSNKIDLSELDLPLPKYDSPFSPSEYGYGSPRGTTTDSCTAASVETWEMDKKSEASSNMSVISENLYFENIQESGFSYPFSEFWEPEPMSPFSFYGNASYDIGENLHLHADIDGILIDPFFQF